MPSMAEGVGIVTLGSDVAGMVVGRGGAAVPISLAIIYGLCLA